VAPEAEAGPPTFQSPAADRSSTSTPAPPLGHRCPSPCVPRKLARPVLAPPSGSGLAMAAVPSALESYFGARTSISPPLARWTWRETLSDLGGSRCRRAGRRRLHRVEDRRPRRGRRTAGTGSSATAMGCPTSSGMGIDMAASRRRPRGSRKPSVGSEPITLSPAARVLPTVRASTPYITGRGAN
jgi:hypothetical protein